MSRHAKKSIRGPLSRLSMFLAMLSTMGTDAARTLNYSKEEKAYGGGPVPQGLMTSFVEIQSGGTTVCGATALQRGWLLSAAHCFVDNDRIPLRRISAATFAIRSGDGSIEIIDPANELEVFIPDAYHPSIQNLEDEFYGDIALIRLPELENHTDIAYPRFPNTREEAELAQILVAIGKGEIDSTGRSAKELEFVSLTREGGIGETPAFASELPIESDHFVLRDNGGEDQSTCNRDSGGGVFIPSRDWDDQTTDPELEENDHLFYNARDVLVGLTSWGPKLPCGDQYGFSTFTDVRYWNEWIQSIIINNYNP